MVKLHNDYYTYAYLREDKTPYYIGKGKGSRIYSKHKRIKPPKDKSLIIFLKKNLTEEEAFKHEIYMIAIFGRKDLGTGILRNLTNGGEGCSGLIHSAERRQAHSERMSGRTFTEEWKQAHSERMSGRTFTEETKKKISEALSGERHPNYGNTGALSPISKAIIAIKPDGTKLYFGGVNEAARVLETSQGNLCGRFLKNGNVGKRGKLKGWRFIYATTSDTNNYSN